VGFGLAIGFNELLQKVTTNIYNANNNTHFAVHYSKYKVFSVCCVFTSGHSPASGFMFSQATRYTSNGHLKTPLQWQLVLVI
jgi:hypothetical protein